MGHLSAVAHVLHVIRGEILTWLPLAIICLIAYVLWRMLGMMPRIKPMQIDGKKTYQIGIPIHWGYRGIAEDAGRTSLTSVNLLSPTVIDPNAYTPEFKGFLVKVERA